MSHTTVASILPAPSLQASTLVIREKDRKKKIPVAFREQIWLRDCGRSFEAKCRVSWCQNRMTVFDFQAGHNIPESKGGLTIPSNLFPICSRCNQSMSDNYTIQEWIILSKPKKKGWFNCFSKPESD